MINDDEETPDPFDDECWREAYKIVAYLRDGVGPSDVITVATLLAIFRDKGAAALGGLMGMAEVIRDRDATLATLHHWRKYSEAYDRHWRDNSRSTTGEGGE